MTIYARALITGATSGIGAAFAAELPAPTSLLLTGRDRRRLEEMRKGLSRPGRQVAVIEADLSSAADRERLAARAETFAIDLLINNAGAGASDRCSRTSRRRSVPPPRSMRSPWPISPVDCCRA